MNRIKSVLLVFLFLLLIVPCSARIVSGYVVTLQNDTINGDIRLTKTSLTNAGYLIKGFDSEALQFMVSFKKTGDKRFKTFEPDQLKAFSFTIDSTMYLYRSVVIDRKSLVESERNVLRFLPCIYDGEIDAYWHQIATPVHTTDQSGHARFHEYFLANEAGNLIPVKTDAIGTTIIEVFKQLGMDPEYVQKLPSGLSFKNLLNVLALYDQWIENGRN